LIDIGNKEYFDGLTYVALSRVRKLEDMIVQPFSFERLRYISNSKAFSFRQAEEERLNLLSLKLNI